ALGYLDLERVVDLGQVLLEKDVNDDAQHLLHAPNIAVVAPVFFSFSHSSPYPRASAPATTSRISCVISDWRTRFISNVRLPIMSCAFSAALRIAVIRAPCSEAADSSRAL